MTVDCGVFNFLLRSVDGKHLTHLQSENSSIVWTESKLSLLSLYLSSSALWSDLLCTAGRCNKASRRSLAEKTASFL